MPKTKLLKLPNKPWSAFSVLETVVQPALGHLVRLVVSAYTGIVPTYCNPAAAGLKVTSEHMAEHVAAQALLPCQIDFSPLFA